MIHKFTIPRLSRIAPVAITVVVAALALVATAQASPKDRNHDGISDRWEKHHHLSLKVNQSRKDQDHDGVVNICEVQAGDNPRRSDSDRDGRRDGTEDADGDGLSNRQESAGRSDCGAEDSDGDGLGDDDENSGRIVSFDGGILTIQTFAGETLTGTVGPDTKIECDGDDNDATPSAPPVVGATVASDRGATKGDDDENAGDGTDKGESCDGNNHRGSESESNQNDDHRDGDQGGNCGLAALVAGAVVHESSLVDGAFVKIELAG
ncbi:MAG: hypothetical protein HY827_10045 [Actinobacteria bacterium]|nr:hypothetical protein [Actinomycetota bacterium]